MLKWMLASESDASKIGETAYFSSFIVGLKFLVHLWITLPRVCEHCLIA